MVMFMIKSNDKNGGGRRRLWSPDLEPAMVRESLEPGQSVSTVARHNGINDNQLLLWRKLYEGGSLSALSAGEAVMPASALSDALKQIRELQPILGKKRWKQKSSKRPWRSPGRENGLRTHFCCRGKTSETVHRMSRCGALAINGSYKAVGIAQSTAPQACRRR
ncbi:transposase [Pseudomonas sp. St29]|nr:transposase [Pseudomonas sp. St29]